MYSYLERRGILTSRNRSDYGGNCKCIVKTNGSNNSDIEISSYNITMDSNIKLRITANVILIFLVILIGITNYWVLSRDSIPSLHDANVCYYSSFKYYKYLIQNFQLSHLRMLFSSPNLYPPLYMLIPIPFFCVFGGPDSDVMAMVNMLYLAILIWSIYKLGNLIYSKPGGLFAAVIVLTFPSIIGFSRVTHINIALTSILAFNLYVLLASDNYNNRKLSIISGVIAGIGCLFSSKYLIYFAGPALIYTLYSFLPKNSYSSMVNKKYKIVNAVFFLFIAFVILALFYIPLNFRFYMEPPSTPWKYSFNLHVVRALIVNSRASAFFAHIIHYIGLLEPHILGPNLLLFLSAIVISVPYLSRPKDSVILFGWFLSPIFILSLCAFSSVIGEQSRFLLPVLPSIAVMVGGLFSKIIKASRTYFPRISLLFIVIFIFLMGIATGISFFKQHPYPQNSSQLLRSRNQYGLLHVVHKKDTPAMQLFNFLNVELANSNEAVSIVTVFDDSDDAAPLVLELIYDELRKTKLNINLFTPLNLSIISREYCYSRKQNKHFVESVFQSARYILYIKNNKRYFTTGRVEERFYRNNDILKTLFLSAKHSVQLLWQYQGGSEDFFTETLLLFRR